MWLLAANPPLRVQALFPKSIHDLFRFFFLQTDLNVRKKDQGQEKLKILMLKRQVFGMFPLRMT